RRAVETGAAGDKYFVLVEGARTASFTGIAGTMPDQRVVASTPDLPGYDPRTGRVISQGMSQSGVPNSRYINERGIFDHIRDIGRTFFDAYLKTDPNAKDNFNAA